MKQDKVAQIYLTLSRTYTTFEQFDEEWLSSGVFSTPFKTLVSVALSTMTTVKRTLAASKALFEKVTTLAELRDIDEQDLIERIKSVAHYNRKAKTLKLMARQIIEDYDGEIPNTKEQLMSLAGIGRKCADVIMNFVFEEPTIAVDTHVFRVVNRLGIVNTKTAEATADALIEITPGEYKRYAHEWLVQHGMRVCVARNPHCANCPLTTLCTYYHQHVGVAEVA